MSSSVWRLTRPGSPTLQVAASHRGIIVQVVVVDEDRLVTRCPLRTVEDMHRWCRRWRYTATMVEHAESKAWREKET